MRSVLLTATPTNATIAILATSRYQRYRFGGVSDMGCIQIRGNFSAAFVLYEFPAMASVSQGRLAPAELLVNRCPL